METHTNRDGEDRGPLDVLVVDDDEDATRALKRAVVLLGHRCATAKDGFEAWEAFLESPPDVVLSDMRMPRMDGLELCRRVRDVEDTPYVYFILMTAFGDREHYLEGMRAGADDYLRKPVDVDELEFRLHSAARLVSVTRRLSHVNAALRRDSDASFRIARADTLTGLGNRLKMDEDFEALLLAKRDRGWPHCIAIADVDDFKAYNDRFGHLRGDEALRLVAHTLRAAMRRADSLYRFGGEEFLVLLEGQELEHARAVMERARAAIEHLAIPQAAGARHAVLSISVGVAQILEAEETRADWLSRADAALYAAKDGGRNRVVGRR